MTATSEEVAVVKRPTGTLCRSVLAFLRANGPATTLEVGTGVQTKQASAVLWRLERNGWVMRVGKRSRPGKMGRRTVVWRLTTESEYDPARADLARLVKGLRQAEARIDQLRGELARAELERDAAVARVRSWGERFTSPVEEGNL
jgi:predicted ArsR family transcriptional regulator